MGRLWFLIGGKTEGVRISSESFVGFCATEHEDGRGKVAEQQYRLQSTCKFSCEAAEQVLI